MEQSTCDKQGNPLGEPKLLGDIEDRQKEESNEDGFKQEVHLSFTSIFSYLLKLLLLNLQQHDWLVDDITEMDFSCATFDTEHFVG